MKTNIICAKCDEAFSVEYSKYSSKKTVDCPTCGTTIELPKEKMDRKTADSIQEKTLPKISKSRFIEYRYILCGIICFMIGLFFLLLSFLSFTIYIPFFVLALVLGVLSIVDKKVLSGMCLIVITILVAAFLQSFLFNREVEEVFKGAGMDVDKNIEEMNESFKDLDKMNKDMQQQLNSLFKSIPKK